MFIKLDAVINNPRARKIHFLDDDLDSNALSHWFSASPTSFSSGQGGAVWRNRVGIDNLFMTDPSRSPDLMMDGSNGRPAIKFDGKDDAFLSGIKLNGLSGGGAFSIVGAVRLPTFRNEFIITNGRNENSERLSIHFSTGRKKLQFYNAGTFVESSVPIGELFIFTAVFSSGNNVQALSVNFEPFKRSSSSVDGSGSDPVLNEWDDLRLGFRTDGSTPSAMELSELIIVPTDLTSSARTELLNSVRTFLSQKYNVS